ncbi:hypothetical protein ACWCPQ_03865 [Nocardia sp. NPDC001965]
MPVTVTVAPGPAIPMDSPGRAPMTVVCASGPAAIAAGPDRNCEADAAVPRFWAVARDGLVGAAPAVALPSRPLAAAALFAEQLVPPSLFCTDTAPSAWHDAGGPGWAAGPPATAHSDAAPATANSPSVCGAANRNMTVSSFSIAVPIVATALCGGCRPS